MSRDARHFWLSVIVCGLVGVVFGATTSQAAINQCMSAENPTNECLTQNPIVKRMEGMGMGLFVGVGGAVGATWRIGRKGN